MMSWDWENENREVIGGGEREQAGEQLLGVRHRTVEWLT